MNIHTAIFLFFSVLFFSLLSCNTTDEESIPSYIQIEKIGLITTSDQGTASHKITDAWVYFGNELIGVFELPATVPVLKSGSHQIQIYPGIKVNGISATRAPYPFYKPINTQADLIRGSTFIITDTLTTYDENTTFLWMEDFNGGALSIDTTANSEVGLRKVSDPSQRFHLENEFNEFSAGAVITGDTMLFECATINSFDLPKGGKPVFLEMNYKNNYNLTVGFYLTSSGQIVQQAILVLNPTETWNKIYINLTPTISHYFNTTDFKIFIGLLKPDDIESAELYFDHLKLIH